MGFVRLVPRARGVGHGLEASDATAGMRVAESITKAGRIPVLPTTFNRPFHPEIFSRAH